MSRVESSPLGHELMFEGAARGWADNPALFNSLDSSSSEAVSTPPGLNFDHIESSDTFMQAISDSHDPLSGLELPSLHNLDDIRGLDDLQVEMTDNLALEQHTFEYITETHSQSVVPLSGPSFQNPAKQVSVGTTAVSKAKRRRKSVVRSPEKDIQHSVGGEIEDSVAALRRLKHNATEIRRRQKVANGFKELGDLLDIKQRDKNSVLRAAIERLNHYEKILSLMEGRAGFAPGEVLNAVKSAADGTGSSVILPPPLRSPVNTIISLDTIAHMIEQVPVAMTLATLDGRYVAVNRQFRETSGMTMDVMSKLTLFQCIPEKFEPRANIAQLISGEIDRWTLIREFTCGRKSPEKMKCTASLMRQESRPMYIATVFVPLR